MQQDNRWRWIGVVLGSASVLLLVGLAASRTIHAEVAALRPATGAKPGGPPPLVIRKDAPLLLLDEPKPAAAKATGKPRANNEPCFVCHGNYREEPLVEQHAKENLGCVECHGSSPAHRDDEDNITPPDLLYASDKIDRMCQKCHEDHTAPVRKVISVWQQKCPAKSDPASLVCTDCHGAHRLPARTVRWDKNTRKLITQKPAAGPETIEKME